MRMNDSVTVLASASTPARTVSSRAPEPAKMSTASRYLRKGVLRSPQEPGTAMETR
jgi:hypothetical protein